MNKKRHQQNSIIIYNRVKWTELNTFHSTRATVNLIIVENGWYSLGLRWMLTFSSFSCQFTVLRCCVAEQRMFRASNSSVLFHFMLLLGLVIAATTLGFSLFQQQTPADKNM